MHNGSATDSDSVCGSSILSSPTTAAAKLLRIFFRGVAQLVARLVRDQEAVGSNPVTPTRINAADSLKSAAFSFVSTHFSTHLPIFFARRAPNPYTRPVALLSAHP